MTRRLLCSLAVVAATATAAQVPEAGRPGDRHLTALAVYQSFEGETADGEAVRVTQVSTPVVLSASLGPRFGLDVRTSYAASEGEGLAPISGLADTQLALSYRRPLGSGEAVVGLAANLPNGDGSRTAEEVETAFLVGQSFYRFQMPTQGQGFNVAPSVTWAVPLSERAVLGLGAAYQVRGAFEPRSDAAADFDPGDELLLTAGVDLQTGADGVATVDVTFVRYGDDTWGELQYANGNAFALTGQWTGSVRGYAAHVLGRLGAREESGRVPGTEALLGLDATVPSQGRLLGSLRFAVTPQASVTAYVQGRSYAASDAFGAKALLDVGVEPALALTEAVSLVGRLGATTGDVRGVEAGAGLTWSF